jgi:peptide/nickel transport system substrate-binding protein
MALDRASLLALHGSEELPVLDAPIEFFRSTPPTEPIPFDPEEATRLLRGLGWEDTNGDGVLERDGTEFRFELLVSNEEEAGQAVLVQAWLQDIGVGVDILTFPKGEIEGRVKDGKFDAAIEGENWMFFTMGEAFEFLDPSRPSLIGYDHADLYAATVDWLNDFSDDATERQDRRLWEIFQRDVPVTVLEPTATAVVFSRRVRGIKPWLGFEFLDQVRIEEE